MTRRRVILVLLPCLLAVASGLALGQRFRRGGGGGMFPGTFPDDRRGVPDWKVDERFRHDVFWGDAEWQNFYEQIKRVFPDREPIELELDHKIFQCVYHLKEKPQVPSIHSWQGPGSNVTWEWNHVGDTRTVHYKGIFDDKG